MLPRVWFSNKSQKASKCGKNISDTLGYASCATFLFSPHFDVICDLLLNRRTATWNLFVNNNPSYSRILIGSRLWSIRGQTNDWRHHYKVFPSAVLKCRKVNILRDWAKDKVQKRLSCRGIEQVREARKRKIKPFLLENDTEIIF